MTGAKEMKEAAAIHRRVIVLCTTLGGFSNCAESYHKLFRYAPASGSIVAQEIKTLGSPAYDALSCASMVLGGAQDHLRGLESLLVAESSVYAPMTVARALLESAARAWWLLDPAIEARERISRALTERLKSLHEGAKIVRAMAEGSGQTKDLDHVNARIDHVASIARQNDLRVIEDKGGRPVAVAAERLSATAIVAQLLAGRDGNMEFGEIAFRAWSGAPHGMLWGLTAGLSAEPDPMGQHELIGHLRMTLGSVEQLVAIAAMAFGEAFNREVELNGWDRRDWDAYARQALKDLRTSLPAL